jgi:hypothetical protein
MEIKTRLKNRRPTRAIEVGIQQYIDGVYNGDHTVKDEKCNTVQCPHSQMKGDEITISHDRDSGASPWALQHRTAQHSTAQPRLAC